jgi:hypothetical protein
VAYPAYSVDGVLVAEDCKRVRQVWINCGAECLRGPIIGTDEDNALRVAAEAFRQRNKTALNATSYHQRWFERERQLCLLIPPPVAQVLRVDYYAYLPSYAEDDDTDYFSDVLWPVLLHGAAYLGSLSLWEHKNAAAFGTTYKMLLDQAIAKDAELKLGTGSRRRNVRASGLPPAAAVTGGA